MLIEVIGPDGKPARRRARQRTVPGRALLHETHFPVGALEPIPRLSESAIAIKQPPGWRMYQFGFHSRRAR